jgi:tyrosinase
MYLACFEQIVGATVVELGGPRDWALPYWNYSDAANSDGRKLPPAFRAARTPEGDDNPLRVDARRPGINSGELQLPEEVVSLADCLREPAFVAGADGSSPGFGGPQTRFNHDRGVVGALEATPHGSIHVAVGGWMQRFSTAALDPIFWLHHANVDRLWAVWRGRDATHLDPTEPAWLTALSFAFHDARGEVVSLTPSQVADTTLAPLRYRYEDVSDPLGGRRAAGGTGTRPMQRQAIPEMVGATERPVVLTGQTVTASMSVGAPTGPARASEAGALPARIFLNIENVTGSGDPTSYAVYLNLPPGADPQQHKELFAGILPMFGVAEASRADRNHPGSGLRYALEVSGVVRALEAGATWNPDDLRVTFVPLDLGADSGRAGDGAAAQPIQVGRISLYYA